MKTIIWVVILLVLGAFVGNKFPSTNIIGNVI